MASADNIDLYAILKVQKSASNGEIKKVKLY